MNDAITLKAFFGFKRHPFPPACAPEPLFRSDFIDAALQQAHNALQNRLHVLVTAPAGLGKSSFYQIADMNLEDALRYLQSQLTINIQTEDLREGITAFMQKRDPVWKGR